MIKIIADSACDISKEDEKKYGIDIICFPINVGERSLYDREISEPEFYDLIDSCESMPSHSQITELQFEEIFSGYAAQGYSDIIYVAINSYGSATFSNAQRAAAEVMSQKEGFNIYVVDSLSYSAGIGYPVIRAAQDIQNGKSAKEIVDELNSIYPKVEIYLGCYTLRYVKKSGRVTAAAAFAGELLGFRPVILLAGDTTKTSAKVRGDANVVNKIVDITADRIEKGADYAVIGGRDLKYRDDLAKALTNKLGYPPVPYEFRVGGVISSNAGPDVTAVVIMKTK